MVICSVMPIVGFSSLDNQYLKSKSDTPERPCFVCSITSFPLKWFSAATMQFRSDKATMHFRVDYGKVRSALGQKPQYCPFLRRNHFPFPAHRLESTRRGRANSLVGTLIGQRRLVPPEMRQSRGANKGFRRALPRFTVALAKPSNFLIAEGKNKLEVLQTTFCPYRVNGYESPNT